MAGPAQPGVPLFKALGAAGFRMACGNGHVSFYPQSLKPSFEWYDNAYLDFPGGCPWGIGESFVIALND